MKTDIIIFGASGYTGQFIVEEVGRVLADGESLTFAIAGRNPFKLKQVLETARQNTTLPFEDVEIILADVSDPVSLVNMAKKGKLVINCVGPYRFYGEKVVEACIAAGTDHIDISGEPQYLEIIQLRHSEAAQRQKVHIVGSCGFDSVPADMGVVFLKNKFSGDLSSVEMIVGMDDKSVGAAPINDTTLECAVHGYTERGELKVIRGQLYADRPARPKTKLKSRGVLSWCEEAGRWCLPNLASDKSVVNRTQYLNHKRSGQTPIQFEAYFGIQSLWYSMCAILFGLVFTIMTKYSWSRKLLIKFSSFFSFGLFTSGGPKRSDLLRLKFCLTLIGQGWAKGRPRNEDSDKPDSKIVAKVTGPDPGYFGTAIIITQCALVLLKERNKIPQSGGVHTPGAAFEKTTLLDRLNQKGIEFNVQN